MKQPPEMKRIAGDDYELLGGNPDNGFPTKERAIKLAIEWKMYPKGGKARVLKDKFGRWWVYGN